MSKNKNKQAIFTQLKVKTIEKETLVGNCSLECVILQQPACLNATISFREARLSAHITTITAVICPNSDEKEGPAEKSDTLRQHV